jgi:site-specific recombinase XerD
MVLRDAIKEFIEWRAQNRKPRTINGFISHLIDFGLWLRDMDVPIREIRQSEIEQWINLHKEFHSPNTVAKKVMAIQMFFNYCLNRGWDARVRSDLLLPPRREFVLPRVANEKDYRKLINAIPGNGKGFGENYWNFRDKALIMLLHDTFARNSEIRLLEMDDIDISRQAARIKTGKSRGTIPFREIFWTKEANSALKYWLKKRERMMAENPDIKSSLVFFNVKARGLRGTEMSESYVGEILRKWSNRAGLPVHINPHSFRHRGGRLLAMNDTSAHGIASILGHKQVQSSFPYTMLFGKDREELYRRKVGK